MPDKSASTGQGGLQLYDKMTVSGAKTQPVSSPAPARKVPRAPRAVSSESYREIARRYSRQYGVDESLVLAVIQVESAFNANAVSPKGAQGLMQIMPGTQKHLNLDDPFDPEANIEAGVRYLRDMVDRFGSVELALAAYNAGPGNVEKHKGLPPFRETVGYLVKVLILSKYMK